MALALRLSPTNMPCLSSTDELRCSSSGLGWEELERTGSFHRTKYSGQLDLFVQPISNVHVYHDALGRCPE